MIATENTWVHMRVRQQEFFSERWLEECKSALPSLPDLKETGDESYLLVDWDHHLPSRNIYFRINKMNEQIALKAKEDISYIKKTIGKQNLFPEFDTSDFSDIKMGSESYVARFNIKGELQDCRLISEWKQTVDQEILNQCLSRIIRHKTYIANTKDLNSTHPLVGRIALIGWAAPCETNTDWAIEFWLTTKFKGRQLSGIKIYSSAKDYEPKVFKDFTAPSPF